VNTGLQVVPNRRREGIWQWAIRKHGKLIQRSDRDHPSEAKARSQGMETIEKLVQGSDEGRASERSSREPANLQQ
jgi:hypothetical protein